MTMSKIENVTPTAEAARVRLGRARATCRDLLVALDGSAQSNGLFGLESHVRMAFRPRNRMDGDDGNGGLLL